jgi:hypothetical protein
VKAVVGVVVVRRVKAAVGVVVVRRMKAVGVVVVRRMKASCWGWCGATSEGCWILLRRVVVRRTVLGVEECCGVVEWTDGVEWEWWERSEGV